MGRTFSVNVCLIVCKCVFCRGSENDSCPLSKSRCTLSVWRFCSNTCTGPVTCHSFSSYSSYASFSSYPTRHTLSHEKVSPFLWLDSVVTPEEGGHLLMGVASYFFIP